MTDHPSTVVTCKFPGCQAPPDRTAGPGRPADYCADPGHNMVSAWRERRRLIDAERGVTTTDADKREAGHHGTGHRRRDAPPDA